MKRQYVLIAALAVGIIAFALVIEVMFSGTNVSFIDTHHTFPPPS